MKVKWLVTVGGYNQHYTPSYTAISIVIELKYGIENPVDWFLSKPKVHSRFEFVPSILIGFWKMDK